MINVGQTFTPRVNPANADYPFGSIKDNTSQGANDGTPLAAVWGNDFEGFRQAAMVEAGLTPNGTPDTALSSQLLDALKLVATDPLRAELAAPGSTVSIAGLEAGKVKDAADDVRAVTLITGSGAQSVSASQIGSSLLFTAATAVAMPTIASLGGVTGHYRIMAGSNPITLTRIDGTSFTVRGVLVSSITIPAGSDCYVAYDASGVYVYGLATYETIKKSYCLVNATGTGAPNEIVSAALPANLAIDSRYVLTNPFGANVPVICWAEIFANSVWSDPGYIYDSGSGKGTGVAANYVQGSGIVIQTGGASLITTNSSFAGGGHGVTGGAGTTSAPCRVFVQKLGA